MRINPVHPLPLTLMGASSRALMLLALSLFVVGVSMRPAVAQADVAATTSDQDPFLNGMPSLVTQADAGATTKGAMKAATETSEVTDPSLQPRIPLLSVITEIPQTSWNVMKYSFQKERIPAWATIIGTTLVLYSYDPDIYDGAKADGRRWGLGNSDDTRTYISGGGLELLRLPTDLSSGMYFLGDGWTHSVIALSFLGTGYFGDHNRAYNTGLELIHGLITSTLFSQVLKRSAGREDPGERTQARGAWRPFPNVHDYGVNTAKYDAFPSGHVMTATLTFTIINQNYPEYSDYIIPLECAWITALGFEMVNNGVHWASDYPLGIALGYVVGKMSAKIGHQVQDKPGQAQAANWSFYPSVGLDGSMMNALYTF